MGSIGAKQTAASPKDYVQVLKVDIDQPMNTDVEDRLDQIIAGDEPIGKFWSGDSELTHIYNQLYDASEDDESGYKMTKKARDLAHSYYRYYNDGDVPGWATYYNGFRTTTPGWGGMRADLTEAGRMELERRAAQSIAQEYKRYKKLKK